MVQWQSQSIENTHLYNMYQEGVEYQVNCGLREKIPTFIDFYEGRQWPSPTPNTKNLPRPVVNIVKMICRNKKSTILSTPVKILYKSYSPLTNIERFNAFSECVLKELGQNEIDRRAVDDGIKKGSYFYHYYWDSEACGIDGRVDGGVRCELIDPLNIFFENPAELDEQKQKWIIISARKSLSDVIAIADSDINLSELKSDEGESEYSSQNEQNKQKVTLLTRYFKENGEVYCERATKNCIINKPFKIVPSFSSIDTLSEGDGEGEFANYRHSPRQNQKRTLLYPIVAGYYEKREGSIYGLSEIEGIIPNQKAINFNIAMSLLNAQECAWGKYLALPNALKGQKISNTPGQILIDYSGTGEGIKKLSESALSEVPMSLTNTITELTRSVTGASEVMSGEAYSNNLSGAAIAYLQAQAQMPIEDLRNAFISAKRKQGLVIAQFLKYYFYKKDFIISNKDIDGNEKSTMDTFSSYDYENSLFEVVVEAVGGSKATLASDINLLDTCLKNGNISLETYIKAYPESALTNKSEILKQIQAEKISEIQKLKKELEFYKNSQNSRPCVDNQ